MKYEMIKQEYEKGVRWFIPHKLFKGVLGEYYYDYYSAKERLEELNKFQAVKDV